MLPGIERSRKELQFICISVFLKHEQLDSYISSVCHQLENKTYLCGVCDKPSEQRQVVERHIESCHIVTVPFACDLCGASLKTRHGFKRHMRSHKNLNINISWKLLNFAFAVWLFSFMLDKLYLINPFEIGFRISHFAVFLEHTELDSYISAMCAMAEDKTYHCTVACVKNRPHVNRT